MRRAVGLIVCWVGLSASEARGQPKPSCDAQREFPLGQALKKGLVGQALESIEVDPRAPEPYHRLNATSYLADGELPCRFSPQSAWDGRTDTAWCEGAPGPGLGEVLFTGLPAKAKALRVFSGLGKSPRDFKEHGRPKKVRVWVLSSSEVKASSENVALLGLRVVAKGEQTLRDVFGFQALKVPAFKPTPEDQGYVLALEILSVHKGRSGHTCVSELTE